MTLHDLGELVDVGLLADDQHPLHEEAVPAQAVIVRLSASRPRHISAKPDPRAITKKLRFRAASAR